MTNLTFARLRKHNRAALSLYVLSKPQRTAVIGISGLMGSGKSTLADCLIRALHARGLATCLLPFASPVKEIATAMGWNGEKDAKGRRLLQLIGTDAGRECIGDDVWVNLWKQKVSNVRAESVTDRPPIIIADDVRFENESLAIHALGGLRIKVERPGVSPPPRWKFWRRPHASERVLPDELFEIIFENDGDLLSVAEFAHQIATVLAAGARACSSASTPTSTTPASQS